MGRISAIVSNGYAGAAIATMTSRGRRFERVPARPPRARLRLTGGAPSPRASRAICTRAELDAFVAAIDKRECRRLRNIRIHHHHEETP